MFRVYVIELDTSVLNVGRFRRANPRGGAECVYVGSTAKSAEDRWSQHMSGQFAQGRWVQRYGKYLRHDLMAGQEFKTRAEAVRAERALALRLRKEGLSVWSR
jgi:predicted GIY-YIG superfamily endonuclease